jgi:putative hydrolase of the HAD superfamily
MSGVLLWDFEGTLARRKGGWGGAVLEALDREHPGHETDPLALRTHLRDGFPWHQPDVPHPELSAPELWWEHIETVLARALCGVGEPAAEAATIARSTRETYLDPRAWDVAAGATSTLDHLSDCGWRHAILANHVPELPALVSAVGLGTRFDVVLSSAITGYEKPHPEAFRIARRACGHPDVIWMIGDNPVADVGGAEAAGIPAILAGGRDLAALAQALEVPKP